jgi:hypothetical protein
MPVERAVTMPGRRRPPGEEKEALRRFGCRRGAELRAVIPKEAPSLNPTLIMHSGAD